MANVPEGKAGRVLLRCPNEPQDKSGLLLTPERHEGFYQDYSVEMHDYLINNGKVWAFHAAYRTARNRKDLGPVRCATCNAEAIIEEDVQ